MNITDYYPITYVPSKLTFKFFSEGANGVFQMLVMFQPTEIENRFNLALCAVVDGKLRDDINTNNDDFLKIFSTVAVAAYTFLEIHPGATLEIGASDDRRLRVYNGIIRRRLREIEERFEIRGVIQGEEEPYDPTQFYNSFVFEHKPD